MSYAGWLCSVLGMALAWSSDWLGGFRFGTFFILELSGTEWELLFRFGNCSVLGIGVSVRESCSVLGKFPFWENLGISVIICMCLLHIYYITYPHAYPHLLLTLMGLY